MIHPDTEVVPVRPDVGLGVRATRAIPAGTIVWGLDRFDLVLSPEEFEALPAPHRELAEHFGYPDAEGRWIVCWDGGRYVNHSCRPAMRGIGSAVMVAVRDLAPGDEVTCDYAECNVEPALVCRCEAPDCRGLVRGRDLLTWASRWDAEVRALLPAVARVPQPLWPYLSAVEEVDAVLHGRIPMPSLRSVYLER